MTDKIQIVAECSNCGWRLQKNHPRGLVNLAEALNAGGRYAVSAYKLGLEERRTKNFFNLICETHRSHRNFDCGKLTTDIHAANIQLYDENEEAAEFLYEYAQCREMAREKGFSAFRALYQLMATAYKKAGERVREPGYVIDQVAEARALRMQMQSVNLVSSSGGTETLDQWLHILGNDPPEPEE